MDGALVIDKPAGPTSHDVVAVARRALGVRQIGHAGTLDPLATGVLVLLVGRATRLSQFIVQDEKEYIADVRLGVRTATYDAEGRDPHSRLPTPSDQHLGNWELGAATVTDVLDSFRGTFLQTPPPFSAKKVGGRPAYEQARRHQPIELKPAAVTVRELERLPSADPGLLRLRLVVSAGFYVRSLAHDIGQRLGCGAHLEALRRTRSGPFLVAESVPFETVATGAPMLQPLNRLVGQLPAVTISDEGLRLVSHGNAIGLRHVTEGRLAGERDDRIRLLAPEGGGLVAIARRGADGLLHPQVVLV